MKVIIIDKSNKEYMRQIIELEAEVFGKNGAIDYWNLKPLVKYGRVYGLLHKDEVSGCAELIKAWDGKTVYLYGFAVKKSYEGKGYAKKLMESIINQLTIENIDEIRLTVDKENKKAVKFYEKFGFIKTELLEDEYGKGIHRILYKKILNF